ncbi:hypothetical protein [Scytonema sp. NUACC26]|uniref:hypothetical protein n=1 Tax=Scytonema sp. NUACC26 TaxID=3140176 RepID=UPI0038B261F4
MVASSWYTIGDRLFLVINRSGKIVAVPESDLILGTLVAVGVGLLLYKRKPGDRAIARHLFN